MNDKTNNAKARKTTGCWVKFGLPGGETVDIRNKIISIIENYCADNGLVFGNDVDFGAGAYCFLVMVYAPLTEKQKEEIKQIVIENSPSDHQCHFIEQTNQ